jgi:DNA-binding NtrC family response regulator
MIAFFEGENRFVSDMSSVKRANLVAVVNDDDLLRNALRRLLKASELGAISFESAEDLLNSGRLSEIACLIADVRMPGISGLDLQARLKTERCAIPNIGSSSALKVVLEQVERVAAADTTVLVHGETGTGKQLIAHATHKAGSRSGQPLIKLNCAAIPFDLLESELFGHERGAFTGAIAQKIGRFESADNGTLFLDEVGDIPLALQPKLLRVLQEQEFERLGSGCTHCVDVRLVAIAATHRDLELMVKRDQFRGDLYYRLNVFPIMLPPLRDRVDDIGPLVEHYVEFFPPSWEAHKNIPDEFISAFKSYSWPGNIRELQNMIERANERWCFPMKVCFRIFYVQLVLHLLSPSPRAQRSVTPNAPWS